MNTTDIQTTETRRSSACGGYANESTRRTENGSGGGGTRYAPIFEQGGTKFIFLYADTSPSSEEEAWEIGWGMALIECILLGCKYHGEVLAWNPADDPQCQQGELGGKRIAVVGGWGEVLRARERRNAAGWEEQRPNSMNLTTQRIVIAKTCGWTENPIHGAFLTSPNGTSICPPPDYPNDLNWMHEAEKVLVAKGLWSEYCDWLSDECGLDAFGATAVQRAEAFLRTIGKWSDDSERAAGVALKPYEHDGARSTTAGDERRGEKN